MRPSVISLKDLKATHGHSHTIGVLDVGRRNWVRVDVARGLPSSVGELSDDQRAMSLGSSDNRLESLHRIPRLSGAKRRDVSDVSRIEER